MSNQLKILLVIPILLSCGIIYIALKPSPTEKLPIKTEPASQAANTTAITSTNTPSDTQWQSPFSIPEIGVKVIFPKEYEIKKSDESNRSGSFVSYDFNYKGGSNTPHLNELQFFSKASIEQFQAECDRMKNTPCFFGDYPTTERYDGQFAAFRKGTTYNESPLVSFGSRKWLIADYPCGGDSCIIRKYTTFLGDTKLDASIIMWDAKQTKQADAIFSSLKIQ